MLCKECGRPLDVCRDPNWQVETRTCGPTAAVDRWRKENKKPDPGTVLSTVPVTAESTSATLASAPDWFREKYAQKP